MTSFKTSFPDNDIEEWKNKLVKELKIADYSSSVKHDRNGIPLAPIYNTRPRAPVSVSRHEKDWWIVNSYTIQQNEKEINKLILEDLNQGVSGIKLVAACSPIDYSSLLSGVDLKYIQTIWVDNSGDNDAEAQFITFLKDTHYDFSLHQLHIDSSSPFRFIDGTIYINADIYNNTGANAVTELSMITSQVNEALHTLEEEKSIGQCSCISVSVSVDTHFFEQISKLRALHILLGSLCQSYKPGDAPQIFVHANSSRIFLTQRDHRSNLIRNTIAATAAILGGADSLYIYPDNYLLNAADHHNSQRLAKNQQLLLKDESYLNQVVNASDGSYFIEHYTEALAHKAYALFQDLENTGGWEANKVSRIPGLIIKDKEELIQSYSEKKKTLIGVNKHPNNMESVTIETVIPSQWQGLQSINIEESISAR